MKERPILFSGEMVRAILEGRKTQTRRIVTVPWAKKKKTTPYSPYFEESEGKLLFQDEFGDWLDFEKKWKCPYGQPGDELYVKENWKTGENLDPYNATEIREQAEDAGFCGGPFAPLWYPSDDTYRRWGNDDSAFGKPGRLRVARFMPRWASRLQLRVTDVRVERVQEITPSDAKSEGDKERSGFPEFYRRGEMCHVDWFKELWNSINEKRGYGWEANPFVWVVEFERVK
jgi:hypothetical protein